MTTETDKKKEDADTPPEVGGERRETLRGEGERVLDVVAETCTLKEWAVLLKAPLERAMAQGDEALADKLIRAGAEIGTSLHAAVRGDHGKIVELMLESGASVGTKDDEGNTALHFAARLDRLQMARLLLLKGADKDAIEINGTTPLHLAARGGSAAVAEILLIAGADMKLRTKVNEWCPLDCAASYGHSEIMKLLVYSGADVNSCIPKSGKTALHIAAGEEDARTIDVLLEAGADIDARDLQGYTPLHNAALYARVESARSLLEHGADANALTLRGASALFIASPYAGEEGRVAKVIDLLLRWGTDETVTVKVSTSRAADVIGTKIDEGLRVADEVELVRKLLSNAPADRVWRRRGLPVLCRAYPGRVSPGCGWVGLVVRVAELVEEGIFRKVVGYL